MSIDIEKNWAKFIKCIRTYVNRGGVDGVENLISFLERSDFKTAPASTKYHLSCEGGLVQHSLNVMGRLISLLRNEYPLVPLGVGEDGKEQYADPCPYSKESIIIVSLLHDISKANFYTVEYRNVQNQETGRWEKVPKYVVRDESDRLIYGSHEENSVYILSKFIPLTHDEALAIRYHMGGDPDSQVKQNAMYSAYKASTLAALLHIADLMSICLDEGEEDNKDKSVTATTESVKKVEKVETEKQGNSGTVEQPNENAPF